MKNFLQSCVRFPFYINIHNQFTENLHTQINIYVKKNSDFVVVTFTKACTTTIKYKRGAETTPIFRKRRNSGKAVIKKGKWMTTPY